MSELREGLSQYWLKIQGSLMPWLEERLGTLTAKRQQLVTILEVVRVEDHIPSSLGLPGRPRSDRAALARAHVAKMVYSLPTTRALLDRLDSDRALRRVCGWERKEQVPSEATFSRAFAEFAGTRLPERVHEALVRRTQGERLSGHVSRDSTEVEARERPVPKPKAEPRPKRRRGRPRKGEEPVKEPTRLERQPGMTLSAMLGDLPKACDVGTKTDSKGHWHTWVGYKLHLDVVDGQIPVSAILTSASVHDSQVAIPLATMTAQRTTSLYDLMDSAYDAKEIVAHSRGLGHVPIIDRNPRGAARKAEFEAEARRLRRLGLERPEDVRYRERSASERVNGRLKDEFGGRMIRVRGHAKIMCHLMFGLLALTADQLMRLVM